MQARSIDWRLISFVLALVGLGVAGYLTYVHYDDSALVCAVGDCHAVQASQYSEIAGIPVALFGLLMYLAVIGLGLARWRRPELRTTITTALFAMTLAGTIYAAYLTYLEVAVIDAICQWCVASALLTLGILVAEGVGFYRMLGMVTE